MRTIKTHWKTLTAIALAALAFGGSVEATAAPVRDGAHRYDARHVRHHRVVHHRHRHHRVAARAH